MEAPESQERLLLKNARSDKIREMVGRLKEAGFPLEDVDEMVGSLNYWVGTALEDHCARAKPSQYTKR